MDKLDFLDGAEAPNAETQPEEATAAEPQTAEQPPEPPKEPEQASEQPSSERPRDEHGRFAKKEEAPEPVMVPLAALHETRDKVKALEAQLQAMQPQQEQPQAVPDMFEDPQGYHAYIQNTISQTALNDRLNISEEMARQSAGEETVNAAQEWGRQQLTSNAAFAQQFYQQRNPYGFLIREYQRHQALSALGDDPKQIEAFKAWQAAQAQIQQQPAQADPQQQPNPPQSIASAPSAGGMQTIAVGPGVAFDSVIK